MWRNFSCQMPIALLVLISSGSGVLTAQGPTIEKVEITFHTTNDDKDDDTKLQVYVIEGHDPRGNGKEVAGEDSIGYGTTFHDWKDNGPFLLTVKDPKETKSMMKNFTLKMRIIPHGNDTWRFHYTLRLYWNDGTSTVITDGNTSKNGLELNQESKEGIYRHTIAP